MPVCSLGRTQHCPVDWAANTPGECLGSTGPPVFRPEAPTARSCPSTSLPDCVSPGLICGLCPCNPRELEPAFSTWAAQSGLGFLASQAPQPITAAGVFKSAGDGHGQNGVGWPHGHL